MDRIHWVIRDCLPAIAQLGAPESAHGARPEALQARMRALLRAVEHRAREAGYGADDVSLVVYALAALADEVVMTGSGSLREAWSVRPLQLALFGDALAGETFFANLARARKDRRTDVLRVYYLCLLLGFRGRYAAKEREGELSVLLERTRTELRAALPLPDVLAPEAIADGDPRSTPRSAASWRLLTLSPLLLAAVLYLGLTVSLREQLRTLQRAEAVTQGAPALAEPAR